MPPSRRHHGRLACGLIALASSLHVACAVDDPRVAGVVLLDREAVASRASLLQEGTSKGVGPLPVLVVPDVTLELHNDATVQAFSVGSGELVEVRGERLALERSVLGQDVERGVVEIEAPREVADELAALMSAEVAEATPGWFELRVADVFAHLAQLPVDEVGEVRPVRVQAAAAVEHAVAVSERPELRTLDGVRRAVGAPRAPDVWAGFDPVGIYRCDGAELVLDAAGRFSGCGLGAGGSGTYRLEGSELTLESRSGALTLQLAEEGVLLGSAGMRCGLEEVTP